MAVAGLESLDGRLLDGLAFCASAYDAFEAVRASPKGIEELRLKRTPRAKKLLEEVLPLAAFIQSRYGPGCRMRIRWLGGNQPFDARILYRGALVDWMGMPKRQYLEITTAVQQTEHLVREHLNAMGGAFTARGTHRDPKTKRIVSQAVAVDHSQVIGEFSALISSRVTSKAARHYPLATTLLVNCDLGEVVLEDEWDDIVRAVRATLSHDRTAFQEVVLVHAANHAAVVARRAGGRRRPNKNAADEPRLEWRLAADLRVGPTFEVVGHAHGGFVPVVSATEGVLVGPKGTLMSGQSRWLRVVSTTFHR